MAAALENRGHFMELLLLSGTSFLPKDKSVQTFLRQTINRIYISPLIVKLQRNQNWAVPLDVEKEDILSIIFFHFVHELRFLLVCASFQNSGSVFNAKMCEVPPHCGTPFH